MSESAKKLPTYEDLLSLPEGVRAEIIDGQVHTAPRPNRGHRIVGRRLGGRIGDAADFGKLNKGWIIETEPDVQFGKDVLIPDLAGWRIEKLSNPDPIETLVTVIPDWTCEIVSPSSGKIDRIQKFNTYLRFGVEYYWIIDPFNKTIEAFRNKESVWDRFGAWGSDDKARIAPFEELEIDLAALWLKS